MVHAAVAVIAGLGLHAQAFRSFTTFLSSPTSFDSSQPISSGFLDVLPLLLSCRAGDSGVFPIVQHLPGLGNNNRIPDGDYSIMCGRLQNGGGILSVIEKLCTVVLCLLRSPPNDIPS
jgi:hypothetical protein